MSNVIEQVDFIILEQELDGPPACESLYERENQFPEHAATWFVTAPCGDIIAVCDKRRAKCRRDGGWYCSVRGGTGSGCNGYHDYEQLEFRRIR